MIVNSLSSRRIIRQTLILVPVALCWLALSAAELCAQGGPPLLTDDPDTPGAGHWEINTSLSLERTSEERLIEAPLLDINYGLGEHIQLKLEVPWLARKNRGKNSENGLGNSNFGVKWRFLDQPEHGFALSIYPQLEFNNPTSSLKRGLVEDGTVFLLPVEFKKQMESFSLNGELGYTVQSYAGNQWLFGLALGHRLSKRIEALAEIHVTAAAGLDHSEWVYNLGGRCKISSIFTLLASGGASLGRSAASSSETILYLGLQMHF